jgi:hypothetical protein
VLKKIQFRAQVKRCPHFLDFNLIWKEKHLDTADGYVIDRRTEVLTLLSLSSCFVAAKRQTTVSTTKSALYFILFELTSLFFCLVKV